MICGAGEGIGNFCCCCCFKGMLQNQKETTKKVKRKQKRVIDILRKGRKWHRIKFSIKSTKGRKKSKIETKN